MFKVVVLLTVFLAAFQTYAAPDLLDNDPFGTPADFIGPADLKSSIYFMAREADPKRPSYRTCKPAQQIQLKDEKGREIAKICPALHKDLMMEGTILIERNGEPLVINVGSNGRFKNVINICPYGFGNRSNCLLPYISLAADKKVLGSDGKPRLGEDGQPLYRIGDVIYVPAVAAKQIRLPNGDIHRGYFIVADVGSRIKGLGRFDVYIGPNAAFNDTNPFHALKLGDARHGFKYFRVKRGSQTEKDVQRFYDGRDMHVPMTDTQAANEGGPVALEPEAEAPKPPPASDLIPEPALPEVPNRPASPDMMPDIPGVSTVRPN